MKQHGKGEMRGLPEAFKDVFRAYRSGDQGPCEVDNELHPVLAIPDWATWSLYSETAATFAATASAYGIGYTSPDNRRTWLHDVQVSRASGDNTIARLRLVCPEGYFEGGANNVLLNLSAAANNLWWPDPLGRQTVDGINQGGPILLEPGTTIEVEAQGAGVAITVFDFRLTLMQTKLIRAYIPSS